MDINTTHQFLERYDGMWFDPNYDIPYPLDVLKNITDFVDDESYSSSV